MKHSNATHSNSEFDLRRHFIWQVTALALGVGLLTSLIVWLFFQAALTQQVERLSEIAQSRASLIQAMARHARNQANEGSASTLDHTLAQLRSAHESFPGIGKTGEFTLAHRRGDQIIFLLSHRHGDLDTPRPVAISNTLAEPMRRALNGQDGTLRGLDYRGETVLAAYRYIPDLDWGIVAKIDLTEVRAPYVNAGLIAVLLATLTVLTSALFGQRAIRPLLLETARNEARYRLLVENQSDLVISFDPDLNLTFVNNNYCETFGRSQESLLSGSFIPLVHEDDQTRVRQSLQRLFIPPYQTQHEERAMTRQGWRWFQWSNRALLGKRGEVMEIIAVGRDITAHKQMEQERAESIRLLRQHAVVFDNAAEAVLIADDTGDVLSVNPAFTRITGYHPEEVVGKNPRIFKSNQHNDDFYRELFATLEHEGRWQGEIWNRHKDGAIFPAWETITRVSYDQDAPGNLGYIAMFSDISERKLLEERMRWLAHHDGLTGLPNRLLFEERCNHALTRARRNGRGLSLLFIDLDNFKPVNDQLGHAIGDQLLQQVAHRLQAAVREEDTVSRLGGDEFTIILEQTNQRHDAEEVAHKVVTTLLEPFEIQGHRIEIGGSIGIALYPENGEQWEELMQRADAAMYLAKQEGRGCYAFHAEHG